MIAFQMINQINIALNYLLTFTTKTMIFQEDFSFFLFFMFACNGSCLCCWRLRISYPRRLFPFHSNNTSETTKNCAFTPVSTNTLLWFSFLFFFSLFLKTFQSDFSAIIGFHSPISTNQMIFIFHK